MLNAEVLYSRTTIEPLCNVNFVGSDKIMHFHRSEDIETYTITRMQQRNSIEMSLHGNAHGT